MEYVEILFKDEWGICIKSNFVPSFQQAIDFMNLTDNRNNYTVEDIENISPLTEKEAYSFYDMSNVNNWPILS